MLYCVRGEDGRWGCRYSGVLLDYSSDSAAWPAAREVDGRLEEDRCGVVVHFLATSDDV